MNNNFVSTGFFEGVSYIFSHFFEFFKLFMFTILNSLVMALLGKVPFIGWILSMILGVLIIGFIPYGVTTIVCDIKIDFEIYPNYMNFLSTGIKSSVILQYLKIIFLGVFVVLGISLFTGLGIGVLYGVNNSNMAQGVLMILILGIIAFVIFSCFAEVKMMVTLWIKIISCVYEDYELVFWNQNKSCYKMIFVWMFVHIINLIAFYAICSVIAIDIKSYYKL